MGGGQRERARTNALRAVRRLLASDGAWTQSAKNAVSRARDVDRLLQLADWCRLAAYATMASDDDRAIMADNVDWPRLHRAAMPRCERLAAYPGVQWVSIGYRHKAGVWTDEPSIVAYVARKWTSAARSKRAASDVLPRYVNLPHFGRTPVDVVAVGRVQPATRLKVGYRAEPTNQREPFGTFGLFARDATSGEPVAVTAAHVLKNSVDRQVRARPHEVTASFLVGNVVRIAPRGFDLGAVDASFHELKNELPGRPRIAGVRPVHPTDVGEPFETFGAATGSVVRGTLVSPEACHSNLPISRPILVRMDVTFGDSGGLLVDIYNYAVGILHGICAADRSLAVFTPLAPGLGALGCVWDDSL